MLRGLYSAATGMRAQEINIDTISNNIANANTTGFKKQTALFADLMYSYLTEPGSPTSQQTLSPTGLSIGHGVKATGTQRHFTQGDLTSTGNQLDLAIQGDGFFEVLLPDGSLAYTRAGELQLDQNGNIVTVDGYQIQPAITIAPGSASITIGKDGTVSAIPPGETEVQQIGQMLGSRFPNKSGLRAIGNNLYQVTEASGQVIQNAFNDQGMGVLTQGFLESSNVSIVEQVVSMITGQRAYEANSKGIQTADDMLQQAINLKR
jgi:flagellar basal-body rod protein FlgG